MYTLLTESLPINMLELQPSLLFKERQPSPRYSQKQPSGSVLWNSCSKTFHKILRKPSVVEWFSLLKLKNYIPQQTISSKISQIFESSFFNTFRRLLPWNKKPSRSSRPKEFLEVAVLKYLWKLSGNYLSYSVLVVKIKKKTPPQIFSWELSRIFSEQLF